MNEPRRILIGVAVISAVAWASLPPTAGARPAAPRIEPGEIPRQDESFVAAGLAPAGPGSGNLRSSPASPEHALSFADTTDDGALFSREVRPTLAGTAPPGTNVTVTIGGTSSATTADETGAWSLVWPDDLAAGLHPVVATTPGGDRLDTVLLIQPEEPLPYRALLEPGTERRPEEPTVLGDDVRAFTDRWRIVPPPVPLTAPADRLWDPYHRNRLKGDEPIWGDDIFLVLGAISDTLVDYGGVPVPAGISTDRPGSVEFFGREGLLLANQNLAISADLYRGDTAFKPFDWRVRATVVGNVNYAQVSENAVVKPDVRRGTTRTDGRGSLQELFVEKKLADLSPNYDFVSIRAGIQPFTSDFRGFVFSDTNLGVRLFGNLRSNRYQYNLAWFEQLEKDTNSGLNTLEWRDQRVLVANLYRQDFPVLGLTLQGSVHHLLDEPSFHFDRNGFLVRPDPAGSFTPHEVEALYVGAALFGHVDRINVDGAVYHVTGEDSLNPIAGPERIGQPGEGDSVDISATMAALELSIDRDFYRPKIGVFWASGDDDPTDRDAEGFDAIFDNPAFAGGAFSFWNRLGIRLGGTAVTLVNRGSLLPDLKSSKEEGQPNFVNPGLLLGTLGVDFEATPKLRLVGTANYLRFDTTETLELLLFQSPIGEEIGWDLSVGARYRPLLNENVVILGGVAALVPGDGFIDIYEDDSTLFAAFTALTLTY